MLERSSLLAYANKDGLGVNLFPDAARIRSLGRGVVSIFLWVKCIMRLVVRVGILHGVLVNGTCLPLGLVLVIVLGWLLALGSSSSSAVHCGWRSC